MVVWYAMHLDDDATPKVKLLLMITLTIPCTPLENDMISISLYVIIIWNVSTLWSNMRFQCYLLTVIVPWPRNNTETLI